MTHSYAKKAWVLEHLHRGVLGRDAIARGCGIPPRTVATWHRSEIGRLPPRMRTPREDERALGITLLQEFPGHREQIASMLRTKPRTLVEWRMQNRSKLYSGDLILATRLGVLHYTEIIHDYIIVRNGRLEFTRGNFPSAQPIYEVLWQIYDYFLITMLNESLEWLQSKIIRDVVKASRNLCPKWYQLDSLIREGRANRFSPVLIGPHKYRNAIIFEDGDIEFDNSIARERQFFGGTYRRLRPLLDEGKFKIAKGDYQETLRQLRSERKGPQGSHDSPEDQPSPLLLNRQTPKLLSEIFEGISNAQEAA